MDIILWGYLALINITALIVCAFDKHAAKKSQWRVPEKTLFVLSIVGGSAGMLLGMMAFHHKTRKPAFYIGIPAILILQLLAYWYLFLR